MLRYVHSGYKYGQTALAQPGLRCSLIQYYDEGSSLYALDYFLRTRKPYRMSVGHC